MKKTILVILMTLVLMPVMADATVLPETPQGMTLTYEVKGDHNVGWTTSKPGNAAFTVESSSTFASGSEKKTLWAAVKTNEPSAITVDVWASAMKGDSTGELIPLTVTYNSGESVNIATSPTPPTDPIKFETADVTTKPSGDPNIAYFSLKESGSSGARYFAAAFDVEMVSADTHSADNYSGAIYMQVSTEV